MFNRRILLAMAMAVLMSSSAWAGGNGGTKKDATISVRNDSGAPIAAFIDPNLALVNALPAVPTQAQIEAAGGKLVTLVQRSSSKSSKVLTNCWLVRPLPTPPSAFPLAKLRPSDLLTRSPMH